MEKVVRSQTGGGENLRRLPSGRNYSACLPQDRSIIAPILSLFSSLSFSVSRSLFFSFLDSNVTVVSSSRLMHEYRTRPVSRSQLRHRAKYTIINGERANLHYASLALLYVTLTRPPFAFSPAARRRFQGDPFPRLVHCRPYVYRLIARRRLESHRSLPALHPLTFSFLSRVYVSIYTRTRHAERGYRSCDAEPCHLPPVAAHFRSREPNGDTMAGCRTPRKNVVARHQAPS